VLFPFRLLRAMFHFLNFMSVMFSGKPLTSIESNPHRPDAPRMMSVWGQMIDTRRAMNRSRRAKAPVKLAPKTWVLVRRGADGQERELAEHVISFDVASDGQIVYTDGGTVFSLRDGESPREICREQLIEKVVILEG
jgi:hypothetical protein